VNTPRKPIKAIATVLAERRTAIGRHLNTLLVPTFQQQLLGRLDENELMAHAMSDHFKKEYDGFDSKRFLRDCGLDDK